VVPGSHKRFRAALAFLGLWLVVWAGNSAASFWLHLELKTARQIAVALILLAAVQVTAGALFDFVTERTRVPRFAAEMVVVVCYLGIVFNLFYNIGVNVTGIFATSAVATAVIGLALQDMMGNIASGIALEFESDIQAGDFITVGESSGWVRHVRLRHTAIETPDGDRVLLPNSLLTRSSVRVSSGSRRRLIPFTMPYAVNPQELIDAATLALRSSPIPDVAAEPAPSCLVRELAPGHIQYAAVVWVTRPGDDSKPISEVLNRLCFGLQRAGIPIGEITNLLEMKAASDGMGASANPVDVLRRTLIFRQLDDAGLFELGARLHHLSFAPGELIVRQGDAGDSMYIVTSGQVAISYAVDRSETQVAMISPGDFFGEASLLTGEVRNASAIALSRVDCYRLEKAGLQGILSNRLDLAEDMSVVLAHRLTELDISREKLDLETARLRAAESQTQLLARIRRFFGLKSNSAKA
jgi:small-conductance mechanosensitive channel/CRP-like cAMP-binding protein